MYYESCLDTNDTVEILGAKPMLDLIQKVGGWAVTSSGFNIDRWTLQNITQIIQNKYNVGMYLSYISLRSLFCCKKHNNNDTVRKMSEHTRN